MQTSLQTFAATACMTLCVAPVASARQQTAEVNSLNTTSQVEPLRGPLSGLRPPSYDGPIKWEELRDTSGDSKVCAFIGFGLLGGLVGVGVGTFLRPGRGGEECGLIAGAVLGAGGVLLTPFPPTIRTIQLSTVVQEIPVAEGSHDERHGKVTSGPYFTQVVSIPESDILLAANNYRAPFIPGQRIECQFFVDTITNQIRSWVAVPGARP